MIIRAHPIIVIEGPDACGKTTLAETICRMWGGRYIHLSYSKDLLRLWRGSLTRAVKLSQFSPVVIDRHWPSEAVYAKVYRGGSLLEAEAVRCDELMKKLGVIYISCLLPTADQMIDAHLKSCLERDEMYAPDERYAQIVWGYQRWRARMGDRPDVIDYDYTNRNLPDRQLSYLALAQGNQLLKMSSLPRVIAGKARDLILEHL